MIGDAVPFGDAAHVGMVGHHAHDVDRQRAGLPAMQQVGEAVRPLRHSDQHARAFGRFGEAPVHREAGADVGKFVAQAGGIEAHPGVGRLERDAHEEEAGLTIGILLAVGDEAAPFGEELADRRDDADAVGADQGQDPGRDGLVVHSAAPSNAAEALPQAGAAIKPWRWSWRRCRWHCRCRRRGPAGRYPGRYRG